jgi:hypothetical protein
MTDSTDYRIALNEKFGRIDDHFKEMKESHVEIKESISSINEQFKKLNGSVRELKEYKIYADSVIEKRGEETDEIKTRLNQLDCDLLEVRFFKKYPKIGMGMIAVIVAMMLLSAYAAFRSTRNAVLTKELKEEVDMINTPVRTRGGSIQWWPSGVVIDSLHKMDTASQLYLLYQ